MADYFKELRKHTDAHREVVGNGAHHKVEDGDPVDVALPIRRGQHCNGKVIAAHHVDADWLAAHPKCNTVHHLRTATEIAEVEAIAAKIAEMKAAELAEQNAAAGLATASTIAPPQAPFDPMNDLDGGIQEDGQQHGDADDEGEGEQGVRGLLRRDSNDSLYTSAQ